MRALLHSKSDDALTPGFLSHSITNIEGQVDIHSAAAFSFAQIYQNPCRTAAARPRELSFALIIEEIAS